MSSPAKILLALLVLALAALGASLLLQSEPPPSIETTTPQQPERPTEPEAPPAAAQGTVPAPPANRTRTEVAGPQAGKEAPQGFFGRVVDPSHAPVANADVYVMPGTGANIFQSMMMASKGVILPPIAAGKTDQYGNFRLGVSQGGDEHVYEFRAVTPNYVELSTPNLRVKENEWYDLGTVKLDVGTELFGQVTVAGSGGLPVANAEVRIRPANQPPTVAPTPGRELGLVVRADENGHYRATNVAASFNVVSVGAVAQGFALAEVQNVALKTTEPNELDIQLSPGLEMAGTVTDAAGVPVGNARLRAIAISSKTPATLEARSDREGKFQLLGLVEGPYILQANAQGYVQYENKPLQAGDKDVHVILEKQGEAKIQVFAKSGRVMASGYTLELKVHHADSEHYGKTDIRVQARPDSEGITTVTGIDPGNYVFQVEAAGHAMAFSDPFRVELGGEPPLLIVRLNAGGVLEGVVQQVDGTPIPGATVATLSNDIDLNPFVAMFGDFIPVKITRKQVTTDQRGRFRLDLLNAGTYQLQIAHPSYIESFVKDNIVAVGQTTTVPPIVLPAGTAISGAVYVDGMPAGQVKVTISTKLDEPQPGVEPSKPPRSFHAEAFSDAQGKFAFAKKVPPGRYEVMANRQNHANPFEGILDVMKSKQTVEIFPAQDTRQITIQIASR